MYLSSLRGYRSASVQILGSGNNYVFNTSKVRNQSAKSNFNFHFLQSFVLAVAVGLNRPPCQTRGQLLNRQNSQQTESRLTRDQVGFNISSEVDNKSQKMHLLSELMPNDNAIAPCY